MSNAKASFFGKGPPLKASQPSIVSHPTPSNPRADMSPTHWSIAEACTLGELCLEVFLLCIAAWWLRLKEACGKKRKWNDENWMYAMISCVICCRPSVGYRRTVTSYDDEGGKMTCFRLFISSYPQPLRMPPWAIPQPDTRQLLVYIRVPCVVVET